MPGQTANGLPYPLGTEPVRDGDNAIKALADALQVRGHGLEIQSGIANLTPAGGNVSFFWPHQFKAGGSVHCVWTGVAIGGFIPLIVINSVPDSAGVTLYVREMIGNQPWGTGFFAHWVAIGQSTASATLLPAEVAAQLPAGVDDVEAADREG